ncbi:MAG: glycosyl hydrolase [Lachnospiraceae bacterium]|nr:glycosyl hydrolase [Lachnospiraceae bacterium]
MRIGRKKSCTAGILMAALLMTGCGVDAGQAQAEEERQGEAVVNTPVKEEQPEREVSYSLWNAYWNLEGVEAQTEELAVHVKNVNFFAAYYDKDDTAFIPQATTDFFAANGEDYKKRGWNRYLTVVNDKINEDGSSSLKSPELLYRLLEKEEVYKAHADSLIALAKDAGYDGLEIDYENIRKDNTLWEYYMSFIAYLYDRCTAEGLLLRVVIETNINADKIPWVEGPVYSVMCYNLYGSHSGPGPKADHEFLQTVMNKMRYVPGTVDYALANGGFDWGKDGSVVSLTTKQAEMLMSEYEVSYKVDESGAKYYSYQDESGVSHEVWYGDQETLEQWMKWLQDGGNWDYSLWRLGE